MHLRRAQADEPHDAAQEQIHFVVLTQDLHRAAAHQAIVGMVVDHVDAEPAHQPVESGGGHSLQTAVAVTPGAHSVDDVIALLVVVQHLRNHAQIVLQIGIQADHYIAGRSGQPCEQRVLVSDVARQQQAGDPARMRSRELLDQRPGAIGAAVVDQQHQASRAAAADLLLLLDQLEQRRRGAFDYLLLVVAWHHKGDRRRRTRGLAHELASRYRPPSTSSTPPPALSVSDSPSISTAPAYTSTNVSAVKP